MGAFASAGESVHRETPGGTRPAAAEGVQNPPRRCLLSQVANSIDESTFNQIASKREGQSKILRLLDELAAHYQTLWGLGEHP
jgi:hypothetical protein